MQAARLLSPSPFKRLGRVVEARALSGVGGSGSEDAYLETWQRSKVKPAAFYEAEGKKRRWFYTVDLQGRLFLEQMRVKNLTSCLKSSKFLDFFFSRVKRNDTGPHPEYPFVSPCGSEMNYILPADMPIVFHDLVLVERRDPGHSGWELRYGGALAQPFDPASVFISPRTGRLYHALGGAGTRPRFGLLRSHVGLLLMDRIHYEEEAPLIEWPGKAEGDTLQFPIRLLPEEEEPVWGLPPPMPQE